jgi:hypothetical protein
LGSGERRHFEAGGEEESASDLARVSAARADECSCGPDVGETNGAEFSALASATEPATIPAQTSVAKPARPTAFGVSVSRLATRRRTPISITPDAAQ